MNQAITHALRQVISGFLFTSGGVLAIKLFDVIFHWGILR